MPKRELVLLVAIVSLIIMITGCSKPPSKGVVEEHFKAQVQNTLNGWSKIIENKANRHIDDSQYHTHNSINIVDSGQFIISNQYKKPVKGEQAYFFDCKMDVSAKAIKKYHQFGFRTKTEEYEYVFEGTIYGILHGNRWDFYPDGKCNALQERRLSIEIVPPMRD